MKKIMVFDVPAESGGALTILNQFYEEAKKDTKIQWIFIISTPMLKESANIQIKRYPWIKKSWFHRLFFDWYIASKIVKKHQPDEILSLQNLIIPNTKVKQTVYLHQSLPFSKKQFKITKNFKLWVYQNLIGRMIYQSIKKADHVIVQTEWIKEAAVKKTGADEKKFILMTPKVDIYVTRYYCAERNKNNLFFYPAGAMEYKNHKVIIEALTILNEKGISNYEVAFTLRGNENKNITKLAEIIKKNQLPVQFVGDLSIKKVFEYYEESILIFPSYLETFGLPLLEKKIVGGPIIASDFPYSHEVLEGYDDAFFFKWNDSEKLAALIFEMIDN